MRTPERLRLRGRPRGARSLAPPRRAGGATRRAARRPRRAAGGTLRAAAPRAASTTRGRGPHRRRGQHRLLRAPVGAPTRSLVGRPADLRARDGTSARVRGERASTSSTAARTRTALDHRRSAELLLEPCARGHARRRQRVRHRRRRRQAHARLRRGHDPLLPRRGAAAAARCRRSTSAEPGDARAARSTCSTSSSSSRAAATAAAASSIGPHAEPRTSSAARDALRARARASYVAQEMVLLSCHPTVDRRPARAAPRRPAAVRLPRRDDEAHVAARRAHPGRLRRGRDGRQLVAERRRQGHVGAGR